MSFEKKTVYLNVEKRLFSSYFYSIIFIHEEWCKSKQPVLIIPKD